MNYIKTLKGKSISFAIPALVLIAIGFIFGIKGFIIAGVITFFAPFILFILGFIVVAIIAVVEAISDEDKK